MRAPSATPEARLDVRRVAGDAGRAAGRGGQRVDDQDPLGVRRVALLVEQAGLGADRGHRAHGVEEVGEQQREDEQRAATTPAFCQEPSRLKSPSSDEVGLRDHVVGPARDAEAPAGRRAVDLAVSPDGERPVPRRPRPSRRRSRARVVATIEIRIAPRTRRTYRAIDQQQAEHEHQHRPALELAVRAELRPGPWWSAARVRCTKPGVDEADQRDEQADADRDRDLELGRHRVEHRLPEAGEHQHQDDQALEHHQAHRVGPGHLAWRSRTRRTRSARARWPAPAGSWRRRPSGSSSRRRPARWPRRSAARFGRVAAAEELAVGVLARSRG